MVCIDLVLYISGVQKTFFIDSLQFILDINYFTFGGETYWQKKGTTMGTRVAPSYANLFMGSFEEKYIFEDKESLPNIILYKSYIDDLFLISKGNEEEAMRFVDRINGNDQGIRLTLNSINIKLISLTC